MLTNRTCKTGPNCTNPYTPVALGAQPPVPPAPPAAYDPRVPPPAEPTGNPSLTPPVIAATFIGLVLVGVVTSSFGPLLAAIRDRFGLTDAGVATFASVQLAGAIVGNLSTRFLTRFSVGSRMAGGLVLFGAGGLLFALASQQAGSPWPLALAAGVVMGLGYGTFQVNYADLFSRGFGARSGAVMAVMSTSFSGGSIIGPALAGLFLGRGWPYPTLYAACAILALLLTLPVQPARDTSTQATATHGPTDVPALALFALFVALYVAAEASASLWSPTHLHESLGYSSQTAAYLTSFFWVALTVGRALAVPLSLRLSSPDLIVASMVVATLGMLLTNVPAVAPAGYWIAALGFAPVFPAGLVWLGRAFANPFVTSVYLVAGSFGALVAAPLMGALKTGAGPGVIPWVILAFSAGTLAVALWLRSVKREAR